MLEPLARAGRTALIPPKANRRNPRLYDKELYEARHLIENFFAKLKQYRAIATRYDKRARNFLAAIHLASATRSGGIVLGRISSSSASRSGGSSECSASSTTTPRLRLRPNGTRTSDPMPTPS